ncbi:MAG: WD40 repeat domain-containing protein, partial [Planctomycetota bacterium]
LWLLLTVCSPGDSSPGNSSSSGNEPAADTPVDPQVALESLRQQAGQAADRESAILVLDALDKLEATHPGLVAAGRELREQLWKLAAPVPASIKLGPIAGVHEVTAISPSADWSRAAISSATGDVTLVSSNGVAVPTTSLQFSACSRDVTSSVVLKGGRALATADVNKALHTWRIDDGGKPAEAGIATRQQHCNLMAVTPDGATLVACQDPGPVVAFRVSGDRLNIQELPQSIAPERSNTYCSGLAISPDGTHVAIVTLSCKLHILRLDPARGLVELLFSTELDYNAAHSVAWSPDGKWLSTAAYHHLALWEMSEPAKPGLVCEYELDHEAGVRAMAFSPCSRYLAVGCLDFAARVLRVGGAGGLEAWTTLTCDAPVNSVAFLGDCRVLLAGTAGHPQQASQTCAWRVMQTADRLPGSRSFWAPAAAWEMRVADGLAQLDANPADPADTDAVREQQRVRAQLAGRANPTVAVEVSTLQLKTTCSSVVIGADGTTVATAPWSPYSSPAILTMDAAGVLTQTAAARGEAPSLPKGVALSPDCSHLLLASGDGSTGALGLFRIDADHQPVFETAVIEDRFCWSVAWASNGKLAAVSLRNSVELFAVDTTAEGAVSLRNLAKLEVGVSPTPQVRFSPDGTRLTVCGDATLRVFRVSADAEPHATLEHSLTPVAEHNSNIGVVSPDGRWLVGGFGPKVRAPGDALYVWRLEQGKDPQLVDGPVACDSWIRDAAIAPDGHTLAVATNDQLWLWSLGNDGKLALLDWCVQSDTRTMRSVAFSPDSSKLVAGGEYGYVTSFVVVRPGSTGAPRDAALAAALRSAGMVLDSEWPSDDFIGGPMRPIGNQLAVLQQLGACFGANAPDELTVALKRLETLWHVRQLRIAFDNNELTPAAAATALGKLVPDNAEPVAPWIAGWKADLAAPGMLVQVGQWNVARASGMAVSADGRFVAICRQYTARVQVCELVDGRLELRRTIRSRMLNRVPIALAFSRDGHALAARTESQTMVWHFDPIAVSTTDWLIQDGGSEYQADLFAFGPGDVLANRDRLFRLPAAGSTSAALSRLEQTFDGAWRIARSANRYAANRSGSPHEVTVGSFGEDGVPSAGVLLQADGKNYEGVVLAISDDGTRILTTSEVLTLDGDSIVQRSKLGGPYNEGTFVGRDAISASRSNGIHDVWSLDTDGTPDRLLRRYSGPQVQLALADGRYLLTLYDGRLILWELCRR